LSAELKLQYNEKVLDVTVTTINNEPKLVVTKFDQNRNKVVLFKPMPFWNYCFCYAEDTEKVREACEELRLEHKITEMNPDECISCDKRPVTKIATYMPYAINNLRNYLWFGTERGGYYTSNRAGIKLLEADVKPGKRVIIDMNLQVYKKQKIAYVDIETDPRERSGILDVTNPPFRMLSVALVNEKGEIEWACFKDEMELFRWYGKQIDKYSIVCSWTNYDVKYPYGRAKRIGFPNYNKFRIPSIDLMSSFSYYSRLASTRGSTRYVSLKEACRKLEIPMASYGAKEDIKLIWDWFEKYLDNGDPTLKKYNVEDSVKILQIDQKLYLSSGHLDMSVYLNVPASDTVSNNYAIDILGLRMALQNKPRIVLPSKPISFMTRKEIKERGGTGGGHSGGAVLKPSPGTHKWTACFDFKSLYPSTMRALNIGIDTVDPEGDIETATSRFTSKQRSILVKVLDVIGKWKEDLDVLYNKAKPGTFEKYRAYTRRRVAKTLYCAVIGVMGSLICRFFNKDVAEAVTTSGRECIRETKRYAENELGLKVIYGDTDSVFIDLPVDIPFQENMEDYDKEDLEKVLAYAQELAKKLNINIRRFGLERYGVSIDIDIETDFICDLFYLSPGDAKTRRTGKGVKKKYVNHCIWEKRWCDYIMIVGFELKRRDWTGLAKTVQKKCFDLILEGKERSQIMEELKPFLAELKQKLYAGELNVLTELLFTKGITRPLNEYEAVKKGHRPPPHVSAAIKAVEYGKAVNPREISYVVATYKRKLSKRGKRLKSRQMEVEPVIEGDIPTIEQTGYDYYWLKQVIPILDRLDLVLDRAEKSDNRKFTQVKLFLLGNL